MRISVIGTGYLGATHAACLASLGFEVVDIDTSADKVAALSRGELPFREPGLPAMLAAGLASGRLRFSTGLSAAADCDVHFICVGTPQSRTGLSADLTAVFGVARGLGDIIERDCLIVGKSTVPVGTAAAIADVVRSTCAGHEVAVAWNPEFLREGHAVADTLRPDRLVFGVEHRDGSAVPLLRQVYAEALASGVPLHITDLPTAELAKTAANAFLATKISFINAMAELSDLAGADVVALADVLGDDTRIGRRFLDAGVGFGGGCLPKDIRALGARALELGAPATARLLGEVDDINQQARTRVVDAVLARLRAVDGNRVAVLGATFKPMSDDVRDSPALAVAGRLLGRGCDLRVFDPEGARNARAQRPDLTFAASIDAALADADVVVHLTEWPQFREIDPAAAAGRVRHPILVDARNTLDQVRWRAAGWTVQGVGRGACAPAAGVAVAGWLMQDPVPATSSDDLARR